MASPQPFVWLSDDWRALRGPSGRWYFYCRSSRATLPWCPPPWELSDAELDARFVAENEGAPPLAPRIGNAERLSSAFPAARDMRRKFPGVSALREALPGSSVGLAELSSHVWTAPLSALGPGSFTRVAGERSSDSHVSTVATCATAIALTCSDRAGVAPGSAQPSSGAGGDGSGFEQPSSQQLSTEWAQLTSACLKRDALFAPETRQLLATASPALTSDPAHRRAIAHVLAGSYRGVPGDIPFLARLCDAYPVQQQSQQLPQMVKSSDATQQQRHAIPTAPAYGAAAAGVPAGSALIARTHSSSGIAPARVPSFNFSSSGSSLVSLSGAGSSGSPSAAAAIGIQNLHLPSGPPTALTSTFLSSYLPSPAAAALRQQQQQQQTSQHSFQPFAAPHTHQLHPQQHTQSKLVPGAVRLSSSGSSNALLSSLMPSPPPPAVATSTSFAAVLPASGGAQSQQQLTLGRSPGAEVAAAVCAAVFASRYSRDVAAAALADRRAHASNLSLDSAHAQQQQIMLMKPAAAALRGNNTGDTAACDGDGFIIDGDILSAVRTCAAFRSWRGVIVALAAEAVAASAAAATSSAAAIGDAEGNPTAALPPPPTSTSAQSLLSSREDVAVPTSVTSFAASFCSALGGDALLGTLLACVAARGGFRGVARSGVCAVSLPAFNGLLRTALLTAAAAVPARAHTSRGRRASPATAAADTAALPSSSDAFAADDDNADGDDYADDELFKGGSAGDLGLLCDTEYGALLTSAVTAELNARIAIQNFNFNSSSAEKAAAGAQPPRAGKRQLSDAHLSTFTPAAASASASSSTSLVHPTSTSTSLALRLGRWRQNVGYSVLYRSCGLLPPVAFYNEARQQAQAQQLAAQSTRSSSSGSSGSLHASGAAGAPPYFNLSSGTSSSTGAPLRMAMLDGTCSLSLLGSAVSLAPVPAPLLRAADSEVQVEGGSGGLDVELPGLFTAMRTVRTSALTLWAGGAFVVTTTAAATATAAAGRPVGASASATNAAYMSGAAPAPYTSSSSEPAPSSSAHSLSSGSSGNGAAAPTHPSTTPVDQLQLASCPMGGLQADLFLDEDVATACAAADAAAAHVLSRGSAAAAARFADAASGSADDAARAGGAVEAELAVESEAARVSAGCAPPAQLRVIADVVSALVEAFPFLLDASMCAELGVARDDAKVVLVRAEEGARATAHGDDVEAAAVEAAVAAALADADPDGALASTVTGTDLLLDAVSFVSRTLRQPDVLALLLHLAFNPAVALDESVPITASPAALAAAAAAHSGPANSNAGPNACVVVCAALSWALAQVRSEHTLKLRDAERGDESKMKLSGGEDGASQVEVEDGIEAAAAPLAKRSRVDVGNGTAPAPGNHQQQQQRGQHPHGNSSTNNGRSTTTTNGVVPASATSASTSTSAAASGGHVAPVARDAANVTDAVAPSYFNSGSDAAPAPAARADGGAIGGPLAQVEVDVPPASVLFACVAPLKTGGELHSLGGLIHATTLPRGASGSSSSSSTLHSSANSSSGSAIEGVAASSLSRLLLHATTYPSVALGTLHYLRHALLSPALLDDPRCPEALSAAVRIGVLLGVRWPALIPSALALSRHALSVSPRTVDPSDMVPYRAGIASVLCDLTAGGGAVPVLAFMRYGVCGGGGEGTALAHVMSTAAVAAAEGPYTQINFEAGGGVPPWPIALCRALLTALLPILSPPVSLRAAVEVARMIAVTQARLFLSRASAAAAGGGISITHSHSSSSSSSSGGGGAGSGGGSGSGSGVTEGKGAAVVAFLQRTAMAWLMQPTSAAPPLASVAAGAASTAVSHPPLALSTSTSITAPSPVLVAEFRYLLARIDATMTHPHYPVPL